MIGRDQIEERTNAHIARFVQGQIVRSELIKLKLLQLRSSSYKERALIGRTIFQLERSMAPRNKKFTPA